MQIDVAMGTLGRHEQFRKAVTTLHELENADRINLYIMDGNAGDEVNEFLATQQWKFQTIHVFRDADCIDPSNAGRWPVIYNFLFKQGNGDLLTYWSDDIFPNTDCFRRGAAHFSDPKVAAVAFAWSDGDSKPYKIYTTEMHNQVMVNFGLFRRTMFESVGMIDEKFHFYYADQDLSLKLWYAGWKVLRDKEAKCTHFSGKKSSNKNRGGEAHNADSRYFKSKWGYETVKNRRVPASQPNVAERERRRVRAQRIVRGKGSS